MRYALIALIIFFCVICIGSASASCISMQIAKENYLPQETLQLEIDADVSYDIATSDIALYRDTVKLPTAVFISKIGQTKWFSWMDLPNQTGNYTIKIKGTCKDGRIDTEGKTFEVLTPLAVRYENFKAKVGTTFEKLPLETHILAAGALSTDALASEALKDYTQRSDSCINSNCTTKNIALTLMAIKDSLIKQKMYSQLLAYQDYAQGSWQLQLTSSAGQECNMTIANITTTVALTNGTNFINVTLTNPRLEIECGQNISGVISYNYNGIKKQFEMQRVSENELAFVLDSGCWGTTLKSSCDSESTAYALFALALTQHLDQNESSNAAALEWLKGNVSSTEEKAILYFLTKDPSLLVGILNDQAIDGWWPEKSLYEPDQRATALVLFALKSANLNDTQTLDAMTNARIWLRYPTPKLADEAFVLFFAFPSSEIEPIMTFWPGIIKTQSRGAFDLILTNKGTTDIEANAMLLNSTTPISLAKGDMKEIHFNVPVVATLDAETLLDNLVLNYKSKGAQQSYEYRLPLVIITEKGSQEQTGNVTSNESAINASQQQSIINSTLSENRTVDIDISLFGDRFKFIDQNVTVKAKTTDKSYIKTVKLVNTLDKELTNVDISPSITLQTLPEIITISPSHIDSISKNSSVSITLMINPDVIPQAYRGLIQATAYYGTSKVNTTLEVAIDITKGITELENCSDMNGTVCESPMQCDVVPTESSDVTDCCVPSSECKKVAPKGRTLGLVVVVVIIIILLGVLFIFRKKPKKEMREFLEESAKVYEKRFQRPPSISR